MKQRFRITGIQEDHIPNGVGGDDGYSKVDPGFRLRISPVNYYPPIFDYTGELHVLTTSGEYKIGQEIEISVQ